MRDRKPRRLPQANRTTEETSTTQSQPTLRTQLDRRQNPCSTVMRGNTPSGTDDRHSGARDRRSRRCICGRGHAYLANITHAPNARILFESGAHEDSCKWKRWLHRKPRRRRFARKRASRHSCVRNLTRVMELRGLDNCVGPSEAGILHGVPRSEAPGTAAQQPSRRRL